MYKIAASASRSANCNLLHAYSRTAARAQIKTSYSLHLQYLKDWHYSNF